MLSVSCGFCGCSCGMSKRTSDGDTVVYPRHFKNPFSDYSGEDLTDGKGELTEEARRRITAETERLKGVLDAGLEQGLDHSDYSVYTGISGYALLNLHLHNVQRKSSSEDDEGPLRKALSYIEEPLRHLKRRRVTFLCGDAGPLGLGVLIYNKLGQQEKSQECLQRLISLHEDVLEDPDLPDEFLYGRAGYLYTLLMVQRHLGKDVIDASIIAKVSKAILTSGQEKAKAMRSASCPLLYEWHGKPYLGAAHGMAGILYILMQVDDPEIKQDLRSLVKPSIDFMLSQRFPSGNCPSTLGSSTDKLIHWCHGAPGWIYMFLSGYKIFNEEKYLTAALKCGSVIWERGLLRKGYGICHGVAGNGYAHLALYKQTGDLRHLHRALKFAGWCLEHGKHGCRTPDRPYSMFEGLAGTIYFLADLINPRQARFPAFEL